MLARLSAHQFQMQTAQRRTQKEGGDPGCGGQGCDSAELGCRMSVRVQVRWGRGGLSVPRKQAAPFILFPPWLPLPRSLSLVLSLSVSPGLKFSVCFCWSVSASLCVSPSLCLSLCLSICVCPCLSLLVHLCLLWTLVLSPSRGRSSSLPLMMEYLPPSPSAASSSSVL